ncbi:hypothetical protein L6R46_28230 [Myxococcota bacterium]|jgi:hypothetical protein|nr:hypothetical protein [Myxococcota bacterium]
MPLDPDSLINVSHEVKKLLPTLDPLDRQTRLAAIEAVRRLVRFDRSTEEELQRVYAFLSRFKGAERSALHDYFPRPLPMVMTQAEVDKCFDGQLPTLEDPADRMLMFRRVRRSDVAYSSGGAILRWLRDHPQGATPAEVDLLASLHDELLSSGLSLEWATLLRTLAPDRAREIAKTTPDQSVCASLVGGDPEGGAIFDARFPNWAEEEAQAEAEYLATLDDDEWP